MAGGSYTFLLSGAIVCCLGFVLAFQSKEFMADGGARDTPAPGRYGNDVYGLVSYLNPIIKNAYKPFGWGVDEAVEALEESAREAEDSEGGSVGGTGVQGEQGDEDQGDEGGDKRGGGGGAEATESQAAAAAAAVKPPTSVHNQSRAREGDGERRDGRASGEGTVMTPEEAALQSGTWHQHGSKRKLNRLPGAKEPNYPACSAPPSALAPGPDATLEEDLEYMIDRVVTAPSFDFPFKSYTYLCDIWPPHLWTSLHALFPPTSVFDRLERNVKRQVRGTAGARKSPYQRFQLNAQEIAGRKRNWRSSAAAGIVWTRALRLLYHPKFEAAVWTKFGLTRKARSREARILVDKDGKAVGRIHPDTTFKILTMQFYFPVSNASYWDYGTCVHTQQQQARRDVRKDEEGDCWAKFAYQPNSGYSFFISRHSYHSSPNSRVVNKGDRRTMLVNWYHT